MALEKPREILRDLITNEFPFMDVEDGVQVFERTAFGLFDEQEHEDERDDVETCKEP
jgi:hypothetical protein